ncbi:hypothetical protein QYM36_002293 [Artemia franciscana]|uniref:PiggyBac transposable element-derived protein domain-containing protein n=1 Tax=Artemia franciscana TaxID=6661 RepID=A0AA88LET5_ARTSF|nr:hypothetical protein QYM36_002293 [Artemia franciscana]
MKCLADTRTFLPLRCVHFLWKEDKVAWIRASFGTNYVPILSGAISGSSRNITPDNWYSSVQLVDELRKHKLTYVGTVKKNKREIPGSFLPDRTGQEGSSFFDFKSNKTVVSYVPKKCKAVLLISSMHHTPKVDQYTG